jgi:hypothetical protein
MSARLPSATIASALIRRVQQEGGFAAVLARGEATGGAILLVLRDRDSGVKLVERGIGPEGRAGLIPAGPTNPDPESLDSYLARRRRGDPDLWIIELDVPQGERFAAETMAVD